MTKQTTRTLARPNLLQRKIWAAMMTLSALIALAAMSSNTHAQTAQAPDGAKPESTMQTGPATTARKYAVQDVERAFAFIDSDHDEKLSRSEAAAFKNVAKYFDLADTNKDGVLSREEFDSALNTTRAQ